LVEAAEADGRSATNLFREHLTAVAEWSEEVEDGDESAAVAYAVEEVYRTADGVTMTDDAEVEDDGSFDLRDHTNIE
jgi:hypothetical protein